MKNYTWEYIQKYPKQTKRLLGIDYQQLEQLMALGKLIHRKNQSEIEKTKIRINQPGSGTPPKLSEEEQIVLMLVYLRHHQRLIISLPIGKNFLKESYRQVC